MECSKDYPNRMMKRERESETKVLGLVVYLTHILGGITYSVGGLCSL